MKNFKNYCFAVVAIVLVWSCQKEEREKLEEKDQVHFFASYNEAHNTKATTPFALGNKATIYACAALAAPSTSTFIKGTPLEATTQAAGLLNPVTALYVPKGSYDFYSVSQNNSTTLGLTFTAGVSGQLTNDIDYLWSKVAPVTDGGNVSFTYIHKAVGVEINITPGSGVTALNVTSIKITPSKPKTTSTMNLSTGTIGDATEKDVLALIDLTGNVGKKIMLPLKSQAIEIEVTANLTIGSIPESGKVYKGTIPLRDYVGGTYYKLNLEVSANAITFLGAKLNDWTSQTIGGVILTEQ